MKKIAMMVAALAFAAGTMAQAPAAEKSTAKKSTPAAEAKPAKTETKAAAPAAAPATGKPAEQAGKSQGDAHKASSTHHSTGKSSQKKAPVKPVETAPATK